MAITGTLTQCDLFAIPSTSHWTGAAIIVRFPHEELHRHAVKDLNRADALLFGRVTDADAVWITEVWDSAATHQASLSLPSVKDAISRGRPLIAGFEQHFETVPVGGHGIHAEA